MVETMQMDKPLDFDDDGSHLGKRYNLDDESLLSSNLSQLDRFIEELPNMEIQLLECFTKYKTQNLRMRRFYKYAVENDQLTCFCPDLIEFWYFWTMNEVQKHIELEEHLSSCYLITHESSVDSVMEKLDMKSAELKKFGELPKELIRSCVQRRIIWKKWLDIKRTMKAYVEKTADLYSSEPEPTEDILTYMGRRNPFTGLELNPETYSRLSLVEKLTLLTPNSRYDMNVDISMIIMEYLCKRIDKENMLQKIEDYCEEFIENARPYILEAWISGHLYDYVHKEMTRQKQKMESSVEDSEAELDSDEAFAQVTLLPESNEQRLERLEERLHVPFDETRPYHQGKRTHDDAAWIHKEIQLVIERNASDIDEEKHRKSFFDDAKSRWQSLLQEGRTHISNKATKSSSFAKTRFLEYVGMPETLFHRLSEATSEIKSVINIINEKIEWLNFLADKLEYCEGKVYCTSKEIFVLGDYEKYTQLDQALIQ